MRGKPRSALGILVASLVIVFLLPTAASASLGYCDPGDWCNYKHNNYNSGSTDNRCWAPGQSDANYANEDNPPDNDWRRCNVGTVYSDNVNDDTSSVINKRAVWSEWCTSSNYGGTCLGLAPNVGAPRLSDFSMNDAVSSHH